MLESINRLPLNKHAKKLLIDQGQPVNNSQMHTVQILQMYQNEGKLDYSVLTRDEEDLEQAVNDLIDLSYRNPKTAAKLLGLKKTNSWEPAEKRLVDDLLEAIDEARLENKI